MCTKTFCPFFQISVTFTFINIEHDRPCDDYIQLFSLKAKGGVYHPTRMTDKICPENLSQMSKKTYTTTEDIIYIEFKSDWLDNRKGNGKTFVT